LFVHAYALFVAAYLIINMSIMPHSPQMNLI